MLSDDNLLEQIKKRNYIIGLNNAI